MKHVVLCIITVVCVYNSIHLFCYEYPHTVTYLSENFNDSDSLNITYQSKEEYFYSRALLEFVSVVLLSIFILAAENYSSLTKILL